MKVGDFSVRHTTVKAILIKVVKHEKTCFYNKHVFISFIFDIFGLLAPEVLDIFIESSKIYE